jgi:hypothetical protein
MMPLHSPFSAQERILIYGPAGSGKTTAWLDIAKWSARTKSDARFYVLDTDFAVDRMVASYPEIHPNIVIQTGYDWNDYMAFQRNVLANARPHDWVIVDFVGTAWEAVQQHYIEEVFNKDIGDYFLYVRKASNEKGLEGWTDWSVINGLYRQWFNPLIFKSRANVLCTAKATPLSSDRNPTEDTTTRQTFLRYGVKPQGQKDLQYPFHTLLITGRDAKGTRTISTVKDREREEVSGLAVASFTLDYLKNIAGWEMA